MLDAHVRSRDAAAAAAVARFHVTGGGVSSLMQHASATSVSRASHELYTGDGVSLMSAPYTVHSVDDDDTSDGGNTSDGRDSLTRDTDRRGSAESR
jgi:hypothetical protein